MIAAAPNDERKFPIGPDSAKALGYDAAEIDALPPSVTESFVGVTNVLSLGEILACQTVVDLGCGAGLDCLLAARRVGPSGKVIGVDMTTEMIEKARRSARELEISNVNWLLSEIEDLMLADAIADVVISNGVFNLCPDKPRALTETYRVLRPGGRLQMADVFLDENARPEDVALMGDWCE
ncbi:MAG: methyltransferase domain-containing protein [Pirellulaceae bacterium]|jgi:ubiquinone/menaquinone biosynthesis C-methylase UbiE|nr:methyltransferase domain-containing protein [Pirellulaceae bacterium]